MSSASCTIAICTYKRPGKLRRCIDSIKRCANTIDTAFSILIIDNDKDSDLSDLISDHHDYLPIRYVKEDNQGLAFAKNRAIAESNTEFIFFLDDDAWFADDKMLQIVADNLAKNDFDALAAHVDGVKGEDFPSWIRTDYYHPLPYVPKRGYLDNGYIQGGAAIYRMEWLEYLGGFRTDLGMSGGSIKYGEDTELEKRLREKGARIIFDPALVVNHEMQYNSLKQLVTSYYQRTLTFYSLYEERLHGRVFRSIASVLVRGGLNAGKGLFRLFLSGDYRLGNLRYDIRTPFAKARAMWRIGGIHWFDKTLNYFKRTEKDFDLIMQYLCSTGGVNQFVEIGGCDGVSFDPLYPFIRDFDLKGVVVEPLPEHIASLQNLYAKNPNVRVEPSAIAERDGEMELYTPISSNKAPEWVKGISALDPSRNPLNPLLRTEANEIEYSTVTVPTLTWSTFRSKYFDMQPDLVLMDVEGYEYRIFSQFIQLPKVLIMEINGLKTQEWESILKRLSEAKYHTIQFTSTDIIAITPSMLSRFLRLRLNLPIVYV